MSSSYSLLPRKDGEKHKKTEKYPEFHRICGGPWADCSAYYFFYIYTDEPRKPPLYLNFTYCVGTRQMDADLHLGDYRYAGDSVDNLPFGNDITPRREGEKGGVLISVCQYMSGICGLSYFPRQAKRRCSEFREYYARLPHGCSLAAVWNMADNLFAAAGKEK